MSSESERPFLISVPESELSLLQAKLKLTKLPTSDVEGAGWSYGTPLADVRRFFNHWKDSFDWKRHEKQLNEELPQFTRDIEVDGHGSLNIHYVHKKSTLGINAIPLLFIHGWPGSFIEVRKILPLLLDGGSEHPSFHVVAISLPNYGFSEAPRKKGFALAQYAEVSHKLMLALGYNEYVTQGGDLGFFTTRAMASIYGGTHSKAWHTNMPLGEKPEGEEASNVPLTKKELAGLAHTQSFDDAYFKIQRSKPQTLSYGITDSPVGLLAWIYEKLVIWSDQYPWTDDEVIEWISIYWFSRAGPGATFNTYYETLNPANVMTFKEKSSIPLGLSHFPKELIVMPNAWTRSIGNVVFDGEHTSGGHFAAHEKPAELVGDVREMFGKGGPAFGVVPGKTGYSTSSLL